MNYLLAMWTKTPEDYFFIKQFINFLKKKNIKSTFVFQKKYNLKSNNFLKKQNIKEIYSSENKFINNLYYLYFLIYFALLVVIKKPKTVYLFNSHSLVSVIFFKLFYSGKIIYHNFDYNPYSRSLTQKILTLFENLLSRYLKVGVFSNKNRGKLFRSLSNNKRLKIITIYNCLSQSDKKFKLKKLKKKKLLFRIGSIGPNHSLENLIISMNYLSDDYNLLLCGKILDKVYYAHLKKLIKFNNLSKKVKIKNSVTIKFWKKQMTIASAGIALYENNKNNISHKYMCGASQKINAYLSENLPILLPNDKQFIDFNKKYKCCVITDTNDPNKISGAIKNIFMSKQKYNKLRKNSYKAFAEEFNFEKQIDKLKSYI